MHLPALNQLVKTLCYFLSLQNMQALQGLLPPPSPLPVIMALGQRRNWSQLPGLTLHSRLFFGIILLCSDRGSLAKIISKYATWKNRPIVGQSICGTGAAAFVLAFAFSPCLLLSPPPRPRATLSSQALPGPLRCVVCFQGSACGSAGCTLSVDNPPGSPSWGSAPVVEDVCVSRFGNSHSISSFVITALVVVICDLRHCFGAMNHTRLRW